MNELAQSEGQKSSKKLRIIVGMTGRRDSTVAAYLLKKQGHEVIGVTILGVEEKMVAKDKFAFTCHVSDQKQVQEICQKLDMPHYCIAAQGEFFDQVVDPTINARLVGKLNSPCRLCQQFKVQALISKMEKLKADKIALGYFAKINFNHLSQDYCVQGSHDVICDQSHLLSSLTQEQMKFLILPLADLKSQEVQTIADNIGLQSTFQNRKANSAGQSIYYEKNDSELEKEKVNASLDESESSYATNSSSKKGQSILNIFSSKSGLNHSDKMSKTVFEKECMQTSSAMTDLVVQFTAEQLRRKGEIFFEEDETPLAEHEGIHLFFLGQSNLKLDQGTYVDKDWEVADISPQRGQVFLRDRKKNISIKRISLSQFYMQKQIDWSRPLQVFLKVLLSSEQMYEALLFPKSNHVVLLYLSKEIPVDIQVYQGQEISVYSSRGSNAILIGSGSVQEAGDIPLFYRLEAKKVNDVAATLEDDELKDYLEKLREKANDFRF